MKTLDILIFIILLPFVLIYFLLKGLYSFLKGFLNFIRPSSEEDSTQSKESKKELENKTSNELIDIIQKLRSDLNYSRNAQSEYRETAKSIEAKYNKALKELERQKGNPSNLESEFKHSKDAQERCERLVREYEAKEQEYLANINMLRASEAQLHEEKLELENNIEKLKHSLSDPDFLAKSLARKINSEAKNLFFQIDSWEDLVVFFQKTQNLNNKYSALGKEKDLLRSEIERLSKKVLNLEESRFSLKEKLSKSERLLKDANKKLYRLNQTDNNRLQEYHELEHKYRDLLKERNGLQSTVKNMCDQVDDVESLQWLIEQLKRLAEYLDSELEQANIQNGKEEFRDEIFSGLAGKNLLNDSLG